MPASRSARAITLAPRSCPSSPGLATSTRIGVFGASVIIVFQILLIARYNEVRNPHERPLELGFGQPSERGARDLGEAEGRLHRIFHRPVSYENLKNLLMLHALKTAVVQHGEDRLPLGCASVFERVDDGECSLAFAQIAGDRLAQHFL